MSVKKFKFVSPGVFINEIDNSQLPTTPAAEGPTIVGRALRGPAMRPVQVDSFEEFVSVFGPPIAGNESVDGFRNPEFGAATYGGFAAQAWLRNSSTINFVRLLGRQHPNYTADSGEAGWKLADFSTSTGGGAYGLWLIRSQSIGGATGTLGAIFYCDSDTAIGLSGSLTLPGAAGALTVTGSAGIVVPATNNELRIVINRGGENLEAVCNFDRTSRKYIRTVFNTDPPKTNSEVTPSANVEEYFLGETFDRAIEEDLGGSSNIDYGIIIPLDAGATADGANFYKGFENSQAGWVISQDLSTAPADFVPTDPSRATKLFKFVGLQTGEYDQGAVKISIENIRPARTAGDFGTFNVIVRRIEDNDAKITEVERYNSLSLNPNSPNYIAAQIGDRYVSWDNDQRVYKEYGKYENNSRYVRMDMSQLVDDGAIATDLVPFGYYGPTKFKNTTITSGSTYDTTVFAVDTGSLPPKVKPNYAGINPIATGELVLGTFPDMVIKFPATPLRQTTATGDVSNPGAAFFGLTTTRSTGSSTYDDSIPDFLRTKPVGIDSFAIGTYQEFSHIFTMDDLVQSGANMTYTSGSRAASTSLTAISGAYSILTGGLAPKGFTLPLYGGFDGLDITEKDPFANKNMDGESELSSYAFYSISTALDSIKDKEVVQTNVLTVPAVTTTTLTDRVLDIAEDRGDCIAIIDLPGGFTPSSESTNTFANRVGSVTNTINQLNSRSINTSYGCAFYPWVRIKDTFSDTSVWVPPSVPALGSFSYTDRKNDPWFAPAGFTRGGLSKGAGGVQVLGVVDRLRQKDRDDLYERNINPIGTFPNEGVVILGQKTLQTTPSALDRINVRRLLIYTKRHITHVANAVLFEPNVQDTWDKFIAKAEPILADIKAGFGLEDYKLVLDETTTTPELRDRNVLYAKVFLKPAKSIEFIALDFVITNSAAVFE